MYRILVILFVLTACLAQAQDKLFLSNGKVKTGIIISVTRDVVYFKDNDTAALQKIDVHTLLLSEDYRGVRHVFAPAARGQKQRDTLPALAYKKNMVGLQPMALFIGRATVVYERVIHNDKIGIVIPFSLTYSPYNSNVHRRIDSAGRISTAHGVSFIAGADVNFYLGKTETSKFFIGPRLRYGTDQFLLGTRGYTLQTQIGWRFGSPGRPVVQHLSLGFGFLRILKAPFGLIVDPDQYLGWYSFNYRISIGW